MTSMIKFAAPPPQCRGVRLRGHSVIGSNFLSQVLVKHIYIVRCQWIMIAGAFDSS